MTDIVERLPPEATIRKFRIVQADRAAADEIERLRQFDRPQPIETADATPDTHAAPPQGSVQERCTLNEADRQALARLA